MWEEVTFVLIYAGVFLAKFEQIFSTREADLGLLQYPRWSTW